MTRRLLPLLALLALMSPAQAAEPLPGDACTAANNLQFSSGPEVSGGGGHAMLCQGGTWKSILSFDSAAGLTKLGNQTCATNEILKFDGTTWACAADAAGSSVWLDGGSGMIYYNGGNVGIGTTAPAYSLDVNGVVRSTGIRVGAQRIDSNGRFYAYSGTAGAPSLSFDNNGTNGFYLPAANTVGWSTNGLERLRVDSVGNVGIGTITPTSRLDIVGNAFVGQHANNATNAMFHVASGGSGNDAKINFGYFSTFDASIWQIGRWGADSSFRISDYTSGSEANRLLISNTGNVGIGTTSPGQKLDVGGGLRVVATAAGTPPVNAYATNGTTLNARLGSWNTDAGGMALYNTAGTLTALISANLSDNSYINAGNVGIGTTAPNEKLEVAQTSGRAFFGDGGGASRKGLLIVGVEGAYSRLDSYDYGLSAGRNLAINSLGGNVGIGTASPGQKLTVAGTIESTAGGIKFPDGTTQATASGAGGISAATTVSCAMTTWGGGYYFCTVACAAGYFRTGCSATAVNDGNGWAASGAAPSSTNACTCTNPTFGAGATCYAYCAK